MQSELRDTAASELHTAFVPYRVPASNGKIRLRKVRIPAAVANGYAQAELSCDEAMHLLMPSIKAEIARVEGVPTSKVELVQKLTCEELEELKNVAKQPQR
jgi:hypothetical protein